MPTKPSSPPPHIETIARGLILHNNHVLLCVNNKHQYAFLPGGHVEFGEPAAISLARELIEEAALEITVGPPLLISEQTFSTRKGKPHHEINLVFQAELKHQPGSQTNHETPPPPVTSIERKISFEWLDLAAVPDRDIRPTSIKAWLATGGSRPHPSTNTPRQQFLSDCDPNLVPERTPESDSDEHA